MKLHTSKRYRHPKFRPWLELTDAHGVLADPRRYIIFRAIAGHGQPIGFRDLKEKVGVPASSLSKILQRFEDAGLVNRTTNLDRKLTISVNVDMLHRVVRPLFDMCIALRPPGQNADAAPEASKK